MATRNKKFDLDFDIRKLELKMELKEDNMGKGIVSLFGLMAITWWLFVAGMSVYGVYLAFSASIIIGVIMFLVAPVFTLTGLLQFFFHFNLPQQFLEFIQHHTH